MVEIAARGIHVSYCEGVSGVLPVLNGLDAEFKVNELSSIVGPSGSGKSTFLNVLAGLVKPQLGSIWRRQNLDRPQCGYVFQDARLIPWLNVQENALFGAKVNGSLSVQTCAKCERLFDRYGLHGFESRYPRTLSGGMQQRVALVRAVLSGASVLLLDEPFSNSDFLTRRALQADLLDILKQERVTAVLVTHDLEEAIRLSNRVIVFSPRPARILLDLLIEIPRDQRMNDLSPGLLEPYLPQILNAFKPESHDMYA